MNLHERAAALIDLHSQHRKNERCVTVVETSYWKNQYKLLADDQAALIAEMDARIKSLEKDAARYQFIKKWASKHWSGTIGQPEHWYMRGWPFNQFRGSDFDSATDTAIEAARKEQTT